MESVVPGRGHRDQPFTIHEDAPSTADTEMLESASPEDDDNVEQMDDMADDMEGADDEDQESDYSASSDDEVVEDPYVLQDMEKLQNSFPGFREKYRLIKRIGEGTFSTVYKAEDLLYDDYDNSWDLDRDNDRYAPPPLRSGDGAEAQPSRRRKPKYVAVKKIYVTSSPSRIFNELDLLHDLRGCKAVCPLITAFRSADQVIAILPYFRHADFRDYFRDMTVTDMAIYLRSLFTALASVHSHNIIHRDIKPTNFLYNPATRRGVLVDFGLAEREGYDCKPCVCHEPMARRMKRAAVKKLAAMPRKGGYPRDDTRPSRRANRAGTRGFRAPEVLFKCTEQTTKIDIWSAGVILLTILSKRFPFFNSADDVEAMIEIATIFGWHRMQQTAALHGCMFETTIPTIGKSGFSFEAIILWSTNRSGKELPEDEQLAVEFLKRCMELDPSKRISAEEALRHEFLQLGLEQEAEGKGETGDDELDILKV